MKTWPVAEEVSSLVAFDGTDLHAIVVDVLVPSQDEGQVLRR